MNNTLIVEWLRQGASRYALCTLVTLVLAGSNIGIAAAAKTAIGGYDPVAYFEMLEAVKGSESIRQNYLGDNWYFANEKHKALFKADPMRYLPTFGGYCSYDETLMDFRDHKHRVNPNAWRIVDNKLYLFASEESADYAMPAEKWEKVKDGLSQ